MNYSIFLLILIVFNVEMFFYRQPVYSLMKLWTQHSCKVMKGTKRKGKKSNADNTAHDGVLAYASKVLNLGLLLMEFNGGIREGDGNCII